MKKKLIRIIVGILLMIGGFVGATMDISTTWHYFGNGVLFGIGLSLLVSGMFSRKT